MTRHLVNSSSCDDGGCPGQPGAVAEIETRRHGGIGSERQHGDFCQLATYDSKCSCRRRSYAASEFQVKFAVRTAAAGSDRTVPGHVINNRGRGQARVMQILRPLIGIPGVCGGQVLPGRRHHRVTGNIPKHWIAQQARATGGA